MEWGYVAGYFDGEGNVSCHKTKRGRRTNRLTWYNTHRASLEAIQKFLGAGYISVHKQSAGQRAHVCSLNIGRKSDILRAIDGMLPYLRVKRDQAIALRNHLACIDDARSESIGKLAAIPIERLIEWYYVERRSQSEIAAMVGVTRPAVSLLMKRRGLQPRDKGAVHRGVPKSDDHKAKIGKAKKAAWRDPKFRAACLAGLRKAHRVRAMQRSEQ